MLKNKNFWIIIFAIFIYIGIQFYNKNKNNPELLGDKYFQHKEIEKAIEFWEKALKERNNKEIYEKIVVSYIIKNDLEEANKWANIGLTYFPNYVNLIFNLALVNFYQGKYSESIQLLDSVLEKDSYFPNAHYLKGLIFETIGEKQKAKQEYIKEVNVNPICQKAWEKIKNEKN